MKHFFNFKHLCIKLHNVQIGLYLPSELCFAIINVIKHKFLLNSKVESCKSAQNATKVYIFFYCVVVLHLMKTDLLSYFPISEQKSYIFSHSGSTRRLRCLRYDHPIVVAPIRAILQPQSLRQRPPMPSKH